MRAQGGADRVLAQEEAVGDFAVGQAGRQQLEDLDLPRAQPGGVRRPDRWRKRRFRAALNCLDRFFDGLSGSERAATRLGRLERRLPKGVA